MQIEYPDPKIVCDACGVHESDSEESASREGWLTDYSTNPHTHLPGLPGNAGLEAALIIIGTPH
jgi:hypothetical protein